MTLLVDPPPPVPLPATSRSARSVAFAELFLRHPELRELGTPAAAVTDALLWSV